MRYTYSALAGAVALLVMAPQVLASEAPADSRSLQTIKAFRNVSGGTLNHGDAVVFQTRDNDTNIEIAANKGQYSSLGLDVTTTTTDDVRSFVGCVVENVCLDDQLCRVVVSGPAMCKWAGLTDNADTRLAAVGTTSVAKNLGDGTNAGVLLSLSIKGEDDEVNGSLDNEVRWIWVNGLGGGD